MNFWDLFSASIHSRGDLSKNAKFHYLVSQLEDEAPRLLSGFDYTAEQYDEAVDLLKTTYGSKRLLIEARLNAIFDLEAPLPNSKSLSKFRSNYECHLRSLSSLGANIKESGYIYAELILRKLPSITRDNINRTFKEDTWTLKDLRKAIAVEINHIRSLEDSNNQGTNVNNYIPTAPFQVAAKQFNEVICRFCSDKHQSLHCKIYDTVGSRLNRVKELRLCFNCLRGNYNVLKCTNRDSCKKCNQKHHTSICKANSNSNSAKSSSKFSKQKKTASDDNSSSMTVLNANNISVKQRSVILPTAVLNVGGFNDSMVA